ncbi:MAG: TlpA family protein disulfide reductase [Chitinophagaceae bacterium]|nr:TlpA family protein disulfide reductase [Chitinophagaceae bacterium]
MQRILFSAFTLVLLLSAGVMACQNKPAATAIAPAENSKTLPELSMKTLSGNTVSLASFKGKKILLNLWASWCGPCREEMPGIDQLAASIDTSKAAIVLLSLDEDAADAIKFMQGKNLFKHSYMPMGDLPDLLNVPGIPASFFFDENGQLVKEISGAEDYNTPAIKALLQ